MGCCHSNCKYLRRTSDFISGLDEPDEEYQENETHEQMIAKSLLAMGLVPMCDLAGM